MKIHRLKLHEAYAEEVSSGRKKAEIRFNDRDYQKGDLLFFTCLHDHGLGRTELGPYEITHVLHGHTDYGLSEDYVILSIQPRKDET